MPTFSFKKTARLRRKLRDEALYPLMGETVVGEVADLVTERLAELLPAVGVDVLQHTVEAHLLGRTLDLSTADWFCMRVAGNIRRLSRRIWPAPLAPWTGQAEPEWLPAQIVGADWCLTGARQRVGCRYSFGIAGGSYAGGVIERRLTTRQAGVLSFLVFGFTRDRRMRDPMQLFGLRCFLLSEPSLVRDNKPGTNRMAASSTMLAYNRTILRRRFRGLLKKRGPDDACPRKFPDSHMCHACSIGLDECYGATHLHQWVAIDCPGCGRRDVPCDEDRNPKLCVNCDRTAKLTREAKA